MNKKQKEEMMKQFFENRDALIDAFTLGEMNKTDFIEKNHAFMVELKMKPFQLPLKDHQECIYNYQFYNIMAKYAHLQAQAIEYYDPKGAEAYIEEAFSYYALKDDATLSFLEYVDYKNVQAYFMNLKSYRLCGQLYEIVFNDYNRAIFHSMNPKILKGLRAHQVFSPVYKDSVISSYVNSVY
jgi:hypothetical protein